MKVKQDSLITNLELKVHNLPPIFQQLTVWLRQGVYIYINQHEGIESPCMIKYTHLYIKHLFKERGL